MSTTLKELLAHKAVVIALGLVGVIAVASAAYFVIATHVPGFSYVSVTTAPIHQDIVATGSVEPVQNPDLSFTSGGRVTYVNAKVGQQVAAGTVLASLDTGVLGAQLQAAQAALNAVAAPTRAVDLAGSENAVAIAQQNLTNSFTMFPTTLLSTVTKATAAVSQTDLIFMYPSLSSPQVSSSYVSDYSARTSIDAERGALNSELAAWENETASINGSSLTPAQVTTYTQEAVTHLSHVRAYLNDLAAALRATPATQATTQTQINAALSSATNARDTVDSLTLAIQTTQQSFATNQLAITSAQDALNQKQAGATPQAIAVQQAQVSAVAAQIRQSQVIAPFSGVVGAVAVKSGDVVESNTVAVSLIPQGSYQVEAQLSELEMSKLATGDAVDVTLDAYGASRPFTGTVASIATAPVDVNGTPSYKVVVVLDTKDPSVAVGMHANLTIHAGSKDAALVIPRSAVIMNGNQAFVIKKEGKGSTRVPVTLGLESTAMVEVVSGLSAGDSVARIGG
ncbi:MAG: putative Secretion protein HlyD family protein [Parcubacteria group bacterium]|nr:putative Secretion protein HlyD family protein [Parcubacteria group bacterium]